MGVSLYHFPDKTSRIKWLISIKNNPEFKWKIDICIGFPYEIHFGLALKFKSYKTLS